MVLRPISQTVICPDSVHAVMANSHSDNVSIDIVVSARLFAEPSCGHGLSDHTGRTEGCNMG